MGDKSGSLRARSSKRALISQREYARRRGISHAAVQHAIKTGRISTVEGEIDPAAADRQWHANTDPSKPRNRITGRPKQVRVPDEPSQPMNLGGADAGHGGITTASGYARARAARELYQAQLAKLALDRQNGVLVNADRVKLAAFDMARKTRDQLMALPERVGAILVAANDLDEVHRILEEEIERICHELSDAGRTEGL